MLFFFSTLNVLVSRERRFFFSSLPFWLLPAVIGAGTIAVVLLCSFNVSALHIRALPLRHQLTLYALAVATRFIINDPIKYVLFRVLLPQEQ